MGKPSPAILRNSRIISVKEIRENAFDIKATSRLNKLYIELLRDNAEWSTAARREDLNHFMARLIFCFFAEDTDILNGVGLFTATVDQMSARDSSNTHEVLSEIFRAMNTKLVEREKAGIKNWANVFPYVNGGLFSGSTDVPRFSKIARSYLMHVGNLDWTKINPDNFGSMIQAVADDEERGGKSTTSAARSRSRTSVVSSYGTSLRKSPDSPSSSRSFSAICFSSGKRKRWRSSCRWIRKTGSRRWGVRFADQMKVRQGRNLGTQTQCFARGLTPACNAITPIRKYRTGVMAEGVGFEPTEPCCSPVFKTEGRLKNR